MSNISLNGGDIIIQSNTSFYVIDALYINDIRKNLNDLDRSNLIEDIRKQVFPYTRTPFLEKEFKSNHDIIKFQIKKIQKADRKDNCFECFSSDTGLIVFVAKFIFEHFINEFDYNEIIKTTNDSINIKYWESLEEKYGGLNCGLIFSPGINRGFDFDGSGLYKIID
jgi:hypothetical protein